MKHIKLSFLFALMLSIYACSDSDDPDGGGDPDNDRTMELTNADFASDLILTDRNEGVDYLVTENIDVYVDLEVRPGVTIEFRENTGIDVREEGTMNAVGIADNPIIFTGVIKSKGAWRGVIVESNSLKNQFRHCEFAFGGSETWGNNITGGLTTWANATIDIDDCTFRDNKEYGVQFYPSKDVEIRSFENNSFENNDRAVGVNPSNVHEIGRGNTYVGNNPMIEVYSDSPFVFGESGSSYTWKAHPIPYRIQGAIQYDGNNVTIEKGSTLLFDNEAYLDARDGGSLTAIGTAEEPIVMDAVTSNADWPGISFQSSQSSQNRLEFVEMRNAGNGSSAFVQGAIYMWASPRLTVENCTFTNIEKCVFYHASSSEPNENLSQTDNNFINAGSVECE